MSQRKRKNGVDATLRLLQNKLRLRKEEKGGGKRKINMNLSVGLGCLPVPGDIVGDGGRALFCCTLARNLLSFSFATSNSNMEGWSLCVIRMEEKRREGNR